MKIEVSWDSAKFKSKDEDHARVVEALRHVCQGEDISDYPDVDNVLKYFAIHTLIEKLSNRNSAHICLLSDCDKTQQKIIVSYLFHLAQYQLYNRKKT